jgi:hypothetical protein
MTLEIIPFAGWSNCLRLTNSDVELVVTLDIGPRILSYRRHDTQNVLKIYTEQSGGSREEEWMIRGGHRLWVAPEDRILSYHRDNEPVSWVRGEKGEIIITSRMDTPHPLRKDLSLELAEQGSRVELLHTITNEGKSPITLATWGLTVLAPGGTEIIPQPPLGEHPRDLLPNRTLVLWPYTDLTDPRWKIGRSYFLLQQQAEGAPTKLGLTHSEHWIGYLLGNQLFLKTFVLQPDASYPDGGCNFETFTDSEMLEIESLGPLVTLLPGESTSHRENWHLLPLSEKVDLANEDSLSQSLSPLLREIL